MHAQDNLQNRDSICGGWLETKHSAVVHCSDDTVWLIEFLDNHEALLHNGLRYIRLFKQYLLVGSINSSLWPPWLKNERGLKNRQPCGQRQH